MEQTNKNDFINVYVLNTLNEIKNTVKGNIKLKPELEKQTDEKMKLVLIDLINANFKNLQRDSHGNLIYTLLPIVDEKENKKVRNSLVLYYTALYYDNVDLLEQMLASNIRFENEYYSLNLQYLDKSLSSKFETSDYIEKINTSGKIFIQFAISIQNLSDEEREKYIKKFVELFNIKYKDILIASKSYKGNSSYPLENLFIKGNLDTFEYDSYKLANNKQLELIDYCRGKKYNDDTTSRLNYLIQNTNFSTQLCDFDLMMAIYSNDELTKVEYGVSRFLSEYSETPEMLQKAIEFITLRPDIANLVMLCVTKEKFMKTSNYVLIESISYMKKHLLCFDIHNIELLSIRMIPRASLKRMLGTYPKNDTQEQRRLALRKKKIPPKHE